MSENMKKWMEIVKKDEALQEKLKVILAMDASEAPEAFVAFAKENGVELTESDFMVEESVSLNAQEGELDEEILENVSGGIISVIIPNWEKFVDAFWGRGLPEFEWIGRIEKDGADKQYYA